MKMINLLRVALIIFLSSCGTPVIAAATSNDLIAAVQDTAITGYIKTKIALDKTIADADVSVTTTNGKVTLNGTVNSDTEASNLIQLVQATSGVNEVDATHLKVKKSKQPFTDLAITAKIKGLFVRDKLFGDKDVALMSIHVETKNGIVYLTGTAENERQIRNALILAKTVKGVSKVVPSVTVVKNH